MWQIHFSYTSFLSYDIKLNDLSQVADIFTSRHSKPTADSIVTCFIPTRKTGAFEKLFTDKFHRRKRCIHISICVQCVTSSTPPHPTLRQSLILHLSTQWTGTKYGQTVNLPFVPNQPGGLSRIATTVCAYMCVTLCVQLCHPQPKHLHHNTTCRQTNN